MSFSAQDIESTWNWEPIGCSTTPDQLTRTQHSLDLHSSKEIGPLLKQKEVVSEASLLVLLAHDWEELNHRGNYFRGVEDISSCDLYRGRVGSIPSQVQSHNKWGNRVNALYPQPHVREESNQSSRLIILEMDKQMQMLGFHKSVGESMKLIHDSQFSLVPRVDQTLEETPISTVSDWVLNSIKQVSEILGLSFKGLEAMAWELFVELEKKAPPNANQGLKRDLVEKAKIPREVKNLWWGLSYSKGGDIVGEGSAMRNRGFDRVIDEVSYSLMECAGFRQRRQEEISSGID